MAPTTRLSSSSTAVRRVGRLFRLFLTLTVASWALHRSSDAAPCTGGPGSDQVCPRWRQHHVVRRDRPFGPHPYLHSSSSFLPLDEFLVISNTITHRLLPQSRSHIRYRRPPDNQRTENHSRRGARVRERPRSRHWAHQYEHGRDQVGQQGRRRRERRLLRGRPLGGREALSGPSAGNFQDFT